MSLQIKFALMQIGRRYFAYPDPWKGKEDADPNPAKCFKVRPYEILYWYSGLYS